MTRRGIGFGFCLLAALFVSTKYISAAIYSTSSEGGINGGYGEEAFAFWLNSVDHSLTTLSVLSLILGIAYITSAEWLDQKHKSDRP